jgi:hypothetical protein
MAVDPRFAYVADCHALRVTTLPPSCHRTAVLDTYSMIRCSIGPASAEHVDQ